MLIQNNDFKILLNKNGIIEQILLNDDKHAMNFVKDGCDFFVPSSPYTTIEKENNKDGVKSYIIANEVQTNFSVNASEKGGIFLKVEFFNNTGCAKVIDCDNFGIKMPFADSYEESSVCMRSRCHMHIWCGDSLGYVYLERMGLSLCNLALTVVSGKISKYSLIRKQDTSNDRGELILHTGEIKLAPNASQELIFELKEFSSKPDYIEFLRKTSPIYVDSKQYCFTVGSISIPIINNSGKPLVATVGGTVYLMGSKKHTSLNFMQPRPAELTIQFEAGGFTTWARALVVQSVDDSLNKRADFIIDKQQCLDTQSKLYGAYLIYDTEENKMVVEEVIGDDFLKADYTASRERVGMFCFLAKLAKITKDATFKQKITNSLRLAMSFYERELVASDGVVYDNIAREHLGKHHRKYNYPFFSSAYYNMYALTGEVIYLERSRDILLKVYEYKCYDYYLFLLPIYELVTALKRENLWDEKAQLLFKHFTMHAESFLKIDTGYTPGEVNYEQSLVAPASLFFYEMYLLTAEEKYLRSGNKHLALLEKFNGFAPDVHLYDIAIRHWDCYWFGKKRIFGDTFPHYWSTLTAYSMQLKFICDGTKEYEGRAKNIVLNNLCLFKDGKGSCAYLYPYKINGVKCEFYDAYANDQDWALFMLLKVFNMQEDGYKKLCGSISCDPTLASNSIQGERICVNV